MQSSPPRKRDLAFLTLLALGVVFGDIGTSPLYTLRECFVGHHPLPLSEGNILGILSLIFWSLIIVVAIKYVVFIMRADNHGEGGVLALLALTKNVYIKHRLARHGLVIAAIFGAALFLGDGMITPAISVLSAVEGLEVVAPSLHHFVLPLAIIILSLLFLMQKKGTARVGIWFGPIIVVWFLVLACLGIFGILHNPHVLQALNPAQAILFLQMHGTLSLFVLGAVVLAVTGGEALYADMGHFGRFPIRVAWFALVLPALVLNYFGQGALLLDHPDYIDNPFFHLAPDQWRWPLLILATAATVIASQAVISGVFSVVRQAVQLGYWPRLLIKHTSSKEEGQIYVPLMNSLLFVSVIVLVLGFQSSSNLAAAYGIAVTGTMAVSTLLALVVARGMWRWSWWLVAVFAAIFLTIDCAFLISNLFKFFDGGWFPVVVAGVMLALMLIWRRGRKHLQRQLERTSLRIEPFVDSLRAYRPVTVHGTAIFLTSTPGLVPHALLHNIQHNGVLHKRNITLTIHTDRVPFVSDGARLRVQECGQGFYIVNAYFGFQETPDVVSLLQKLAQHGLDVHISDVTFFMSRERVIPVERTGLPSYVDNIFAAMHRNAMAATDYFNVPATRVIEVGSQIEI